MANCEDTISNWNQNWYTENAIKTPLQAFNNSDCWTCCVLMVGKWRFVFTILCQTDSAQRALTCDFVVDYTWIDCPFMSLFVFSHGLTDVFQVLLNVVYNLHSSLWDPGSWAEDGTHTALVQELIVLHAHKGGTQLIWTAVNKAFSFSY